MQFSMYVLIVIRIFLAILTIKTANFDNLYVNCNILAYFAQIFALCAMNYMKLNLSPIILLQDVVFCAFFDEISEVFYYRLISLGISMITILAPKYLNKKKFRTD